MTTRWSDAPCTPAGASVPTRMLCSATSCRARTDSLLAFLSLLMSKQETPARFKTWERLTELHEKFETSHLFEYVRYLIQVHRPDAAMSAWEQAAGTSASPPTCPPKTTWS